jgi:hypothetical protein
MDVRGARGLTGRLISVSSALRMNWSGTRGELGDDERIEPGLVPFEGAVTEIFGDRDAL